MGKILIVDDDETLLEMMQDYLEEAGHSHVVLMASKAERALKLFRDTSPDLVIMDIIMPGVDGFELLRQFKEINPVFKTILLSGVDSDECREMANNIGADRYLVKPVNLDSFRALIERMLNE